MLVFIIFILRTNMACDQNNEIDDLNREECASEMEEDCSNYSEQQNMNDKVEEVVDDDDIDDEEGPIICADDSNYQLISHTKDVFCLTISHSKRWLASGSEDDFAFVWDLTTTRKLLRDILKFIFCYVFL